MRVLASLRKPTVVLLVREVGKVAKRCYNLPFALNVLITTAMDIAFETCGKMLFPEEGPGQRPPRPCFPTNGGNVTSPTLPVMFVAFLVVH
jgi:hypothetical protein